MHFFWMPSEDRRLSSQLKTLNCMSPDNLERPLQAEFPEAAETGVAGPGFLSPLVAPDWLVEDVLPIHEKREVPVQAVVHRQIAHEPLAIEIIPTRSCDVSLAFAGEVRPELTVEPPLGITDARVPLVPRRVEIIVPAIEMQACVVSEYAQAFQTAAQE